MNARSVVWQPETKEQGSGLNRSSIGVAPARSTSSKVVKNVDGVKIAPTATCRQDVKRKEEGKQSPRYAPPLLSLSLSL